MVTKRPEIDVQAVIDVYRETVSDLEHRLVMMTAYARTLEGRLAESEQSAGESSG